MIFSIPLAHDTNLVRHLPASQYPYALTIGGVDVISKVVAESLRWSEAGPGGISTMSFTIIDVDSTVELADNADVRAWDYLRDLPVFLGSIESTSKTPWAAQGRSFDVSCNGIESLLDTTIVPVLTSNPADGLGDVIPTGMYDGPMLQLLASYIPVRAGLLQYSHASTLLAPIGSSGSGDTLAETVVLDGKTIRAAFEAWCAASWQSQTRLPTFLSIDFWGGLRYFAFGGGAGGTVYTPSDYATLTINTSGSPKAAASLSWKRDLSSGAVVNAVYVSGAAPASTGWVTGDLSSGRHQATASTSGLTEQDKQAAANGVMGQRDTPAGRGSLTLEDYTPTNVHPGSLLVITDARMGWSSKTFLITQIDKTIANKVTGTQDWTLTFFDPAEAPVAGPPSVMRLVRTHTRGTLN